jgi:hypothetical protein
MLKPQPRGMKGLKTCTGRKKDVAFGGTLADLDPGDLLFPHGRYPLRALDVIMDTLDVIQNWSCHLG